MRVPCRFDRQRGGVYCVKRRIYFEQQMKSICLCAVNGRWIDSTHVLVSVRIEERIIHIEIHRVDARWAHRIWTGIGGHSIRRQVEYRYAAGFFASDPDAIAVTIVAYR